MDNIGQLKVIQKGLGYYVGRTMNIEGKEWICERLSEYMGKSEAENLLKQYQQKHILKVNEKKRDMLINLGVELDSLKTQYIVAVDNEKECRPVILELRPLSTEFEKSLFTKLEGNPNGQVIVRNLTVGYLTKTPEGKNVQLFINHLKEIIDGNQMRRLQKNPNFGYNRDVLLFLENKYKGFTEMSLSKIDKWNELIFKTEGLYKLRVQIDVEHERYVISEKYENMFHYIILKEGNLNELNHSKDFDVFLKGRKIETLNELLAKDQYKILRNAPEISVIYEAIEKDARERNITQIGLGAVDVNNQLVAKKYLELTNEYGEINHFIETAVTYFQSVIPLSKSEFNIIQIGDKITRIGYERRLRKFEKSLER